MSATFDSLTPTSTASKPLWAAVAVLGVTVLAMGAALINIQTQPEEPRTAVLSAATPAPALAFSLALSSAPVPAPLPASVLPVDDTQDSAQKKAAAPVSPPQPATKHVAHKTASATQTSGAVTHPAAQASPSFCANCGTVSSVTPIQRDGSAGGVGAIAGGVLGAVVGNQVGDGNGKTLATILGAVGGGVAGNTVEKKMKKETLYQVRVRMEDGSTRMVEQATPASVGAKVRVAGNRLQAADR